MVEQNFIFNILFVHWKMLLYRIRFYMDKWKNKGQIPTFIFNAKKWCLSDKATRIYIEASVEEFIILIRKYQGLCDVSVCNKWSHQPLNQFGSPLKCLKLFLGKVPPPFQEKSPLEKNYLFTNKNTFFNFKFKPKLNVEGGGRL